MLNRRILKILLTSAEYTNYTKGNIFKLVILLIVSIGLSNVITINNYCNSFIVIVMFSYISNTNLQDFIITLFIYNISHLEG